MVAKFIALTYELPVERVLPLSAGVSWVVWHALVGNGRGKLRGLL